MSQGVNITIKAQVVGDYTEAEGVANADAHINVDQALSFMTGAGVNQADTLVTQQVALGPSGTETLDLASGLTDALNNAAAFARVKAILLINTTPASAVGAGIILAGGASDPFVGPLGGTGPTVTANPGGGIVLLAAPDAAAWAVASGSACNVTLTNKSAVYGVTGTLVILGSAE